MFGPADQARHVTGKSPPDSTRGRERLPGRTTPPQWQGPRPDRKFPWGEGQPVLAKMSGRNTRMAQWLDYRVRVTISDARMLVGTFMAFDKYMNVVLADCEEFRKIKSKGRKDDEKEVKRTLGFVVLRGETIVSLMAEAPPPSGPKKPDIQPGPGRGQVAGRGMPAAPLSSAPAGLAGPVRGVGGPAAIQMQPKAGAALPAPGGAPPGMPPGFPARPPGMPGMVPPGMPGMPPGMPPPGMPGMGRGMPPMGRGA